MNTDAKSAQDDLAFMKSLVQGSDQTQSSIGQVYVAAGLIYGLETLAHWGQGLGLVSTSPAMTIGLIAGATGAFLAVLTWVIWTHRHAPTGGVVSRAVGAAFGGAGLTNLAIICIIGWVAYRERSVVIWQIYPAVVFALQGAAWHIAGVLRRRAWLHFTALGWLASSVALGFMIGTDYYGLVIALALLFLMVLPGLVLVRLSRREG